MSFTLFDEIMGWQREDESAGLTFPNSARIPADEDIESSSHPLGELFPYQPPTAKGNSLCSALEQAAMISKYAGIEESAALSAVVPSSGNLDALCAKVSAKIVGRVTAIPLRKRAIQGILGKFQAALKRAGYNPPTEALERLQSSCERFVDDAVQSVVY